MNLSDLALAVVSPGSGGGHGVDAAPAELILVSLLVLVFWGAFRITSRKRS